MRVINVQVYTEEGVFVPGEIETENGKVSKVIIDGTKSGNVEDSEVIDGEGAYAIPGMPLRKLQNMKRLLELRLSHLRR